MRDVFIQEMNYDENVNVKLYKIEEEAYEKIDSLENDEKRKEFLLHSYCCEGNVIIILNVYFKKLLIKIKFF